MLKCFWNYSYNVGKTKWKVNIADMMHKNYINATYIVLSWYKKCIKVLNTLEARRMNSIKNISIIKKENLHHDVIDISIPSLIKL